MQAETLPEALPETLRSETIRYLYQKAATLAGAGDLDAAKTLHATIGALLEGLAPENGASVSTLTPKKGWRR